MLKMFKDFFEINNVRMWLLAMGEVADAWRLAPRMLVSGYAYMMYKVVDWYMSIAPVLDKTGTKVLVDGPTSQQAALVTTVIGASAAIFAFYANTGRKWADGVKRWPFPQDTQTVADLSNPKPTVVSPPTPPVKQLNEMENK